MKRRPKSRPFPFQLQFSHRHSVVFNMRACSHYTSGRTVQKIKKYFKTLLARGTQADVGRPIFDRNKHFEKRPVSISTHSEAPIHNLLFFLQILVSYILKSCDLKERQLAFQIYSRRTEVSCVTVLYQIQFHPRTVLTCQR